MFFYGIPPTEAVADCSPVAEVATSLGILVLVDGRKVLTQPLVLLDVLAQDSPYSGDCQVVERCLQQVNLTVDSRLRLFSKA